MVEHPLRSRKAPAFVGSLLALNGVVMFLLIVVPLHLVQPDYDPQNQLMSELVFGPHGWVLLVAFAGLALSAFGAAAVVWSCRGSLFLCLLFALAGLCFLASGVFPLGRNDNLHIGAIAAAFVTSVLGMYLFSALAGGAKVLMPKPLSVALASGVAGSVLLGHSVLNIGVAQRMAAISLLLWFAILGWRGMKWV